MKKNILIKSLVIAILFLTFQQSVFSQGVIISNTAGETSDPSAMLEVKSTTQGLLIPRMTTAQRNTLSATAVDGLLIFDSDRQSFFIFGNSKWTDLSMSAEIWSKSASNVYLTNSTDNIGVGTSSPGSKFVIQANSSDTRDDVLFEVIGTDGIPVFEVTTNGVKVCVNGDAKAVSGGFAVGQYNSAKATVFKDFFTVDNLGNSRVHLHDDGTKAISGGFAVGQYNSAKGYTPVEEYLNVASDHTQVNSTNPSGKAISGGFAVGQYNSAKGRSNFMNITPDNYFIGHDAGLATIPGTDPNGLYNIFLGFQSGLTNTTGSSNTYVGHLSGQNQILGTDNVFLGNAAGQGLTTYTGTSLRNVILGAGAGRLLDDAIDNVFIGHLAGEGFLGAGVTGDYNIVIGESAGRHLEDGSRNVFLGNETGFSNTGGDGNVFLGYRCGYSNISGEYNTFMGYQAGRSNTSGSGNMFLGYFAGDNNTTGNYNTIIGFNAGILNNGASNTFVGNTAGSKTTSGNNNTFLGAGSGLNNNDGSSNVFIGPSAGRDNLSSFRNVYIGHNAGLEREGGSNVLIGAQAGYNKAAGNKSVAIGDGAGYNFEGDNNVFLGYQAGYYETGSEKLYISNDAVSTLIYGEFDNSLLRINGTLHIGTAYSLPTSAGTSGQVLVTNGTGNQASWNTIATGGVTAGNGLSLSGSQVQLGGTNLIKDSWIGVLNYTMGFNLNGSGNFYIYDGSNYAFTVTDDAQGGTVGIGTQTPTANLHIKQVGVNEEAITIENDTNTDTWSFEISNPWLYLSYNGTNVGYWNNATGTYNATSDKRLKKDIKYMDSDILSRIMKLKPATYRLLHADKSGNKNIGFVAQEVQEFFPEIVYQENTNDYLSLNYSDFGVLAIKAIQEQQIQIEKQQIEIDLLKKQNSKIESLEKQIQELKDLIQK